MSGVKRARVRIPAVTTRPLPLACSPGALEGGWAAHEKVFEQLTTRALEVTLVPAGVRVLLARDDLDLAAAFIRGESQCCAFFSFRLTVPSGQAPIEVEVTGPEEAQELLSGFTELVKTRGGP